MTECKLDQASDKINEARNIYRAFMVRKTQALRGVGMHQLAEEIEANCDLVSGLLADSDRLIRDDTNEQVDASMKVLSDVTRLVRQT